MRAACEDVASISNRMFVNTAAAVQGNLEISVSRLQNPFTNWPPWPLKNVRIKQFGSPAELENAILASACVVPFPPVHIEGLGYCIECACGACNVFHGEARAHCHALCAARQSLHDR